MDLVRRRCPGKLPVVGIGRVDVAAAPERHVTVVTVDIAVVVHLVLEVRVVAGCVSHMLAGLGDVDVVIGDPADGVGGAERGGGAETEDPPVLHSQETHLAVLVVDQQVSHLPDVVSVLVLYSPATDVLSGVRDCLTSSTQPAQRCGVLRRHCVAPSRSFEPLTLTPHRRAKRDGGTPVSYTHLTLP